MPCDIIPHMRVYNNSLICFKTYEGSYSRTERQIENDKNLTRGEYNGYMSPKTRSKVRKYLSTWLNGIRLIQDDSRFNNFKNKPYTTFITTTLPATQRHSDCEIKRKVLTPFIESLKRTKGIRYYFWRAEAQQNGNIHFHILTDAFIHHKDLRDLWNEHIGKLGYIDDFEEKHNHRDPNSTDIHALEEVNNLEAYIIKYVSKEDGYRPIKGRIWGCSDELRELRPYEQLMDIQIDRLITSCQNDRRFTVRAEDDYVIVNGPVLVKLKEEKPDILNRYTNHIKQQVFDLYFGRKGKLTQYKPKSVVPEDYKPKPNKITTTQLNFFHIY